MKEGKKRLDRNRFGGRLDLELLSIEKIAERCLLGQSARVTFKRRSYGGEDGKTRKIRTKQMMHSERRGATTRLAHPLKTASKFEFIRTKVSRLTLRGANTLHERSVRDIAHIEGRRMPPGFSKAVPETSIGEMSVARYTCIVHGTFSR